MRKHFYTLLSLGSWFLTIGGHLTAVFLYQPVLHDWVNKGCNMCYPSMVHIKDLLLLIEKSRPCSGGSGFLPSLFLWSYTTCPPPYNGK